MKNKKLLLVFAFLAALVLTAVIFLFASGIIVFDNSASRVGEGVRWNGVLYLPAFGEYSEGKTVAKTKDGWRINEVEEDKSHTFIVLRSFIDQYFLVREDYEIPTEGEITLASWNRKYINDKAFIAAINGIITNRTPNFDPQLYGEIFELKENQHMRQIFVAYENCPVATEYIGYLGKINDTWCITANDAFYEIPREHWEILEKYF